MDSRSIVILGNGFDVALGIPTRYSEFYHNSQELYRLADNGNALCKHIIDNIDGELWSDLESGLYQYSLGITRKFGADCYEQTEKFKTEFNELRTALFNYLNSVAGTIVDVNKEAPALGLNIEWHELQPQYLTFNYSINTAATADMNSRYIYNNDDTINELRFIYQHGSIFDPHACKNHRPEDIVVGIDSQQQVVEPSHSFLYKTCQNQHDLEKTLDVISQKLFYIIYGCSIGDSDATYFRTIFSINQHNKVFLIYGYGINALNTILKNIERICEISIDDLKAANNIVVLLDVQDVGNTRRITRELIGTYLKRLVFDSSGSM